MFLQDPTRADILRWRAATEAPRMRVGTGLLLLAIVAVLVSASGYTALADAIAMGYLALATSIARRSPVGAPALRAVPVRSLPDTATRAS
jgi:hypothetical protein